LKKLAFPSVATGLFTRHALTVLCSKRCQNLSCKSRRCSEDGEETVKRQRCDTDVFRGLRRSPASRFASFHRNVPRCRNEGCIRWSDEVVEGKKERERKRGTTTHVTSDLRLRTMTCFVRREDECALSSEGTVFPTPISTILLKGEKRRFKYV